MDLAAILKVFNSCIVALIKALWKALIAVTNATWKVLVVAAVLIEVYNFASSQYDSDKLCSDSAYTVDSAPTRLISVSEIAE